MDVLCPRVHYGAEHALSQKFLGMLLRSAPLMYEEAHFSTFLDFMEQPHKRSRTGARPPRKQLLTHLPTDLIHLVLGFLWYDELIGRVNRTCQALRQLIKDGGHGKIEQPTKITDLRKFVVTIARLLFNQPMAVVDSGRKYPNTRFQRDLDIMRCRVFSMLRRVTFKKGYFDYLCAPIMNMCGYPDVHNRDECIMRASALPLDTASLCDNVTWLVERMRRGWTRVIGNEFTTFSKPKCGYKGIRFSQTNMPNDTLSYTEWRVLYALMSNARLGAGYHVDWVAKLSDFHVPIEPFDTLMTRSHAAKREPVQLTVRNAAMARVMSVLQLE